jgi:CheY-like chemotaxis protein
MVPHKDLSGLLSHARMGHQIAGSARWRKNMTAVETLVDTENAIPVTPGTQNRIVRVLLVDDHQVVREGLKRILEMEWSIKVVGEAGNGEEAIAKASALVPDVVVMDLKMPGMDGISATREIKKRLPDVSVLMLTLYAEDFLAGMPRRGAILFSST